jgi:hypothetical protein
MIGSPTFRVGDRVEIAHRIYRGTGGNNYRGEVIEVFGEGLRAGCRVKMDDCSYDDGVPEDEGGGTGEHWDGRCIVRIPLPNPGYVVRSVEHLRPLSLLELLAEAAHD